MKPACKNREDTVINLEPGHPSLSLFPLREIEKSVNRVFLLKDPAILQYGPEPGDEFFRLIRSWFLSEVFAKCITPECGFIIKGIPRL